MARKYQHTQELLPQIKELLACGMTQKEVEDKLGLTGYRPIHQLLKRERKREAKIAAGIMPVSKGRPRKDSKPRDIVTGQAYEIHRLKMENTLLRDFLLLTRKE